MARRNQKPVEEQVEEELEQQEEELEADPVVDPAANPLVPDVDEEQAKLDHAQKVAAAQAEVEVAQSEVEELEAKLEAAKKKVDNTQRIAAEVEADPIGAIQPCCLPQHDPTLRSARTTKQAEEMTRTLRNNNPK